MAESLDPLIRTSGLVCGYGSRTVLTAIDLEINRGEVVALLGSNGSGKSTLLKTFAGAIPPLVGRVMLGGRRIADMKPREVAVLLGYVPQSESPTFDFTVREIVLMGRISHSDGLFETPEDRAAAERAMVRADCIDLADRPVSELSGGEGQRALIARALAQETSLMLLDEPTSHLDVRHQLEIGDLILELAAEGIGILVAMHDLNWTARFSQRAVVLHQGRIWLSGNTGETISDMRLDEAFGVSFQRSQTDDGVLTIFPEKVY
ncbi:MAG: ABC transporter ATP-binding protein [Armatimonadetes bacterium]|nr:ABC transporter ATP-binding protein [Armatimonadota bacterium]